jgi:hypothetical protein
MSRIICFIIALVCGAALLAGCGPTPKIMVTVSEAEAANLTKETQAKIKEGMTLEEVNAAVAPLLGQSGMFMEVKEDSVYEVGWQDAKTKKAILVKFKGSRVTGTSTVNIP